jgi:TusA-related sulfurtransferase
MIEMGFEITIRNYDSGNILKIIIDTTSIEVIIGHIKSLQNGHDILKIKKIIPIVVIEDVVVY